MSDWLHIAPSVTKLKAEDAGKVLIAASHGGIYAGYMAASEGARAVILNDAGIGKNQAGIASLAWLDRLGMAAATVGHMSARIGDGQDMAANGIISHVNETARALGCHPGEAALDCAEKLRRAEPVTAEIPPYKEARFLFEDMVGEPRVWGLDSASLVAEGDAGHIVITGSHGGLLAGNPDFAIKAPVLACAFNDAGVGKDEAGLSRLPVLDDKGILAATLDCMTAEIGDARSAWRGGRISHANRLALACGVEAGMTCQDFVDQALKFAKKH